MPDPLREFLRASHLLSPVSLPSTVAAYARRMGAAETVLYLVDYEQVTLVPLSGADIPTRDSLPIEGTVAGRAFRRVQQVRSGHGDQDRLWVPLFDGVERLGVVEFVLAEPSSAATEEDLLDLASLLAELVVVKDAYSDVFARARRRKNLSLAAEIQWGLLPPLTFGGDRLVITGALEPAYEIGGDTFDYAVNGETADLMVLDAVGHGLSAAVLSSVAVGAYRHARRDARDLPEIATAINDAIAAQFPDSQFATALIARLDIDTGRLRWINAGHPDPIIVRGSSMVAPPPCPPTRPLGLQDTTPTGCCETRLEPGDRLLLYTDGITEARSPATGEFFGQQRLADFIATASAAAEPAPETVRRLIRAVMGHQGGRLQDDGSIVVLEWRTGDEHQLVL